MNKLISISKYDFVSCFIAIVLVTISTFGICYLLTGDFDIQLLIDKIQFFINGNKKVLWSVHI